MTRWIRTAGLALVCLMAGGVPVRADFDKGLEAYSAGRLGEAMQEWQAAAQAGSAPAQWLVGNMYLNGEGLAGPDPAAAARYYEMAARQGYAEAQVSLGTLFRLGEGVTQNYRQALSWLYEAAAKKHPVAQMDLGDLFLTGIPGQVTKDVPHAMEWFRLAAKQGVILAQFKLAQLYLEDVGGVRDPELGASWMAIANQAAVTPMESALSRRVMALDRVVETDPRGRTLGEIIRATYRQYRERLPGDLVARAEAKAKAYDPGKF